MRKERKKNLGKSLRKNETEEKSEKNDNHRSNYPSKKKVLATQQRGKA